VSEAPAVVVSPGPHTTTHGRRPRRADGRGEEPGRPGGL